MKMGDRIKSLRVLNGMTQEELGRRVGVKKAAVQKWESGLTENLKRSTIKVLSDIFDVSPSYLMCMTDDMNNNSKNAEKQIDDAEDIITMAAHKVGHVGPLTEEEKNKIELAIKIALAKYDK